MVVLELTNPNQVQVDLTKKDEFMLIWSGEKLGAFRIDTDLTVSEQNNRNGLKMNIGKNPPIQTVSEQYKWLEDVRQLQRLPAASLQCGEATRGNYCRWRTWKPCNFFLVLDCANLSSNFKIIIVQIFVRWMRIVTSMIICYMPTVSNAHSK